MKPVSTGPIDWPTSITVRSTPIELTVAAVAGEVGDERGGGRGDGGEAEAEHQAQHRQADETGRKRHQHDARRADQQAGQDDALAADVVGNPAHDRFGEHDADKLHAEDDADLPRGNAERGGEQGEEGFDCAEYQILRGLDQAHQHDAAVAQHGVRGWPRNAATPV